MQSGLSPRGISAWREPNRVSHKNLRVISNHQPVGLMISTVLNHGRTFADQAILQSINVFDPRVFQKDAVLHDGRENPTSIAYGSKRPDEGILDLNFRLQ